MNIFKKIAKSLSDGVWVDQRVIRRELDEALEIAKAVKKMKEEETKSILRFLDSLETVDEVIMNIADKYTVDHSNESYRYNKKMLTEFAERMGLISKKDD